MGQRVHCRKVSVECNMCTYNCNTTNYCRKESCLTSFCTSSVYCSACHRERIHSIFLKYLSELLNRKKESEVAQSCPTLCDPMDYVYSPPGSSIHGILQAGILLWGCHVLLQGIFPTQGSNPGLMHCRQTLYPLSHQGSLSY